MNLETRMCIGRSYRHAMGSKEWLPIKALSPERMVDAGLISMAADPNSK